MRKAGISLIAVIITLALPLITWAQAGSLSASASSAGPGDTVTLSWCASGGAVAIIDVVDGGTAPNIPISIGCGTTSVVPSTHDADGNGQATYRVKVDGNVVTSDLNITLTAGGGGGGGGGIDITALIAQLLALIPTPTEIIQDILAFLLQPVVNTLAGWLGTLTGGIATFAQTNFSVNGSGFFGQIVDDLYPVMKNIAIAFMVVAFSLTMVQNMIERPLPGVMGRILRPEAVLGRIIIVLIILPVARGAFGTLSTAIDVMAWQLVAPTAGGNWGWIALFINPLTGLIAGGAFSLTILWILGIMALFVLLLIVTIVNNLLWLLALILLPLACLAWLFPFSESLWSSYWWLVMKAAAAPLLYAGIIRLNLELLALASSHALLGLVIMLLINAAAATLILKLVLAAAPAVIGAGMVASGNPMGMPMVINSVSGMFGRGGAQLGRQASQAIAMQRKIGGGDE